MTRLTMATRTPTTCRSFYATWHPRFDWRRYRVIAARSAALALAVVALAVMFEGQRWLLERSQTVPDALLAAACAVDAVGGDASVLNACTGDGVR
jgi:hypothetical protein